MPSTQTHQLCCVRCSQNPPLEVTHYEGNEIDICPKCGGLWCEPETWNREKLGPFPQPPLTLFADGDERAPDIVAAGSAEVDCPNCHHMLTRLDVGGATPIAEIDQCENCGGIWFDHAEMDRLEALQAWAKEKQRINSETTWGNWWFQLLSQMPVEFNIQPRRFPLVTAVLIAINVLIFLFQASTPQEAWIDLAARSDRVLAGQDLETLFTSMFLHGGWLHLLGNMYMLYILGDNVEDVLGRWRYLVFYLVCGLVAVVAFVVLSPGSSVPMLGASGAIAGVMAAYFILFRQSKLTFMFLVIQRKMPVWIWLGVWFLLNLFMSITSFGMMDESGGVAWVAHVGGFLAGLAIIWPQDKKLVQSHALLNVMRMMG